MPISESMVQDIVQEVMAKMQIADAPTGKHGVFKEMNDAIEAAKKAELIVKKMSMDQREKIITCIRKKIKENAEVMARMGVDETGMGNVGDKILKHHLVADKTPGTEDITTTAWISVSIMLGSSFFILFRKVLRTQTPENATDTENIGRVS